VDAGTGGILQLSNYITGLSGWVSLAHCLLQYLTPFRRSGCSYLRSSSLLLEVRGYWVHGSSAFIHRSVTPLQISAKIILIVYVCVGQQVTSQDSPSSIRRSGSWHRRAVFSAGTRSKDILKPYRGPRKSPRLASQPVW
jgi:hypothetical protein